jgi:hypothetical protein
VPRYLQSEMAQDVPVRVQLQCIGHQLRWTGDIASADIGTTWSEPARETHIICPATPEELGLLAFAVARLVIHAERALLIVDVPAWQTFLINLTTNSSHADDLKLPRFRAIGADGAILNPEILDLTVARAQLNNAMDNWILSEIDQHIQAYLRGGDDPGRKIGFRTAPALRNPMQVIWARWCASFDTTPALLNRFLRLILCAFDVDESEGEAQALVGPLKLKNLIRATAVTLTIASGWHAMMPHGARPGNLSREFGNQVHTGHACAADLIDCEMMALSAAKFMWRTHFVVLPMVNRPSEFSILANTSLTRTEDGVPRLTDVDDRTNILITVDEAFVHAVKTGAEALIALLTQLEEAHFRRLNSVIERTAE